ncbi:pilin [uncultured Psychrobacter sp.]|uniref:pilin n=1 Tax=uncultured Psychrobacter sp. TaxID=259303 RepID=UPI002630530C|nr:pilin [uncultured Psychrobacter sp.]
MNAQKGFTLIELMIVIAIIGILAAIALPAYQDYTKRARMGEALSLAGGAKTAVTEYYSSNNSWPADNTAAGLPAKGDITGNTVDEVEVSSGVITVKVNSKVDATNNKLVLSPTAASGSVVWSCAPAQSNGVDAKYLPSECR